ncbi:MAG: hypothetical protein V5A39_07555 [Haloarculaceae archaeon]|jgi:hypothetical protein
MSWLSTLRNHLREHRDGMMFDLVFALVWVTLVSLFVELVNGPQWAQYLLLAAGVPAYFGFVWSLEVAKEQQGR